MEDNLNIWKWKTSSIMLKTEDNINFWKWKTTSIFLKMEDNLIFWIGLSRSRRGRSWRCWWSRCWSRSLRSFGDDLTCWEKCCEGDFYKIYFIKMYLISSVAKSYWGNIDYWLNTISWICFHFPHLPPYRLLRQQIISGFRLPWSHPRNISPQTQLI